MNLTDTQVVDLITESLQEPEWMGGADFIEWVAGMVENTGRDITTPTCAICDKQLSRDAGEVYHEGSIVYCWSHHPDCCPECEHNRGSNPEECLTCGEHAADRDADREIHRDC